MHKSSQIEVEMVFLTKAEGGREQPPFLTPPGSYRPHFVAGDGDYYAMIFEVAPESVQAQVPFTATLSLVYYPRVDYTPFIPGAEFTVREGARVVGRGRVTKRLYDPVAS
jgi:translation elongation factor EF-Tu-like GTPase